MRIISKKVFLLLVLFLFLPIAAFASGEAEPENVVHRMTYLVLQLGVIIFAAKVGGMIFEKIKLPSVLGELFAGVIIGPYLLGGISLPGFSEGLFPLAATGLPVSNELYGISVIASIILLFVAGLETDLSMFLRCSVAATFVGIGGVVFSFILGVLSGIYFLDAPFMDPRCLFLGVISTATSVGITARILSERRKMDSPEGVTILAGAVIDDVLGIIIFAVVLGIVAVVKKGAGAAVEWTHIEIVAIKAVIVWLGFTILGLIFANKISSFLKSFKGVGAFSVLALGLALILAGIFEKAGLAMIIGAYVMGLSLSKTDLSYVIQDKLHSVYTFFVPVFFTVMGMLVNLKELGSKEVLIFGLVYTIGGIVAKIGGCAIPALFLNFNRLGALRIGFGMVSRGEVALIIAGIGLAHGILDDKVFGVSIMMTLLTTVFAPPLLNLSLKNPGRGTRKEFKGSDTVITAFDYPSVELTDLVLTKVIRYFENEGFFINMLEIGYRIYQIRKNKVFISLFCHPQKLIFDTNRQDVGFVKTIVYESLIEVNDNIKKVQDISKPDDLRKELVTKEGRTDFNIGKVLNSRCIIMNLKADSKEDIIKELIDVLDQEGKLIEKEDALKDVFEREESMSTGMEHGVAIPHGKSGGVEKMVVSIGFKREGIDFQSIDGLPSNIFIMVVSPKDVSGPHVQFLAAISTILCTESARDELLACKTAEDVWSFLVKGK